MGNDKNQQEADLKKLSFYRSEIKHEFTLLYNRVSSYVTSQSFLTIAYASAMNNTNPKWGTLFTVIFPTGLALLGIIISLSVYNGIIGAVDTIALWHVKQNKLFNNNPEMDDYRIQRTASSKDSPVDLVHQRSLGFARIIPHVFFVAWCIFGMLTLYLHFK